MNVPRFFIGLALIGLGTSAQAQVESDFLYRPYPVLLVHGFNANTEGTWGVNTVKKEKTIDSMTTHILGFDEATVGNTLARAFTMNNDLEHEDPLLGFPDFLRASSGASGAPWKRFSPNEENGSYEKRDHTYVEVYSPYYYNESDDDEGTLKRNFQVNGADGTMQGYHLGVQTPTTAPGSNFKGGGQTQLLRIRIIQMLNEYYGDWKWVADPTAKIKVLCHSNGGLVMTNLLMEDEKYYSEGYTAGLWWNGRPGGNPKGTDVTSTGFRLRDHIDQVITLNTPFDGSPIASKSGIGSAFGWWIMGSTFGVGTFWVTSLAMTATTFSWTNAVILVAYGAALAAMEVQVGYSIGGGGANTPVIKDMSWHGTPLRKYGGSEPSYSNQIPIPFINYTGRADHLRNIMVVPMAITGYYALYYTAGSWFNWSGIARAVALWGSFAGFTSLTIWLNNSDGIVPLASADMKSVFRNPKRELKHKNYYFHTDVDDVRNELPPAFAGKTELTILSAIGANQPTKDEYVSIPQINNVTIWPEGAGTIPHNENHPVHNMLQYRGQSHAWSGGQIWKRWFTNNNNVIQTSVEGGKPNMVVGNLTDYYMNATKLQVKQNVGSWKILNYKTDFGQVAGRFVDVNGDDLLTEPDQFGYGDKLSGSMFFGPLNAADQCGGQNIVRVRATNKFGKRTEKFATFTDGVALSFHEALDDGNPKVPGVFIGRPMKWNLSGSETKQLVVGFETPFLASSTSNTLAVESFTGSLQLSRTTSVPSAGQFQILPIGTTTFHKVTVALSPSQLKREDGVVTPDQLLNMSLQTQNGTQTCLNLPFFIDNSAPEILLQNPRQRNDFNSDGKVDGMDVCHESVTIPGNTMDCNTVCQATTEHGAILNTQECTLAQQTCQQTKSPFIKDISKPDCDGIDNDFDGLVDAFDQSESDAIRYYSPKYDYTSGELTTPGVDISFKVDDDLAGYFPEASEMKWQIWKVYGQAFNSATDQLLYTENLQGKARSYDNAISADWNFQPYTATNTPPDGLYAAIITSVDQAGNSTVTAPGYFIVDKRKPNITIIKDWQDEQGRPRFDRTSASFGMKFIPGTGTTNPRPYDSETDDVRVTLTPIGYLTNLVEPYIGEFKATYSDETTTDANGDITVNGMSTPDGKIDPNRIFIPNPVYDPSNEWTYRAWGYTFSRPIPDGSYTVSMEAEDKAGNTTTYFNPNQVLVFDRGVSIPPTTLDDLGGSANPRSGPPTGDPASTSEFSTGTRNSPQNDEGAFDHANPKGDFETTIQLQTSPGGATSQAGLMVRNTLEVNGVYAAVLVTGTGQLVFEHRDPNTINMVQTPIAGTYTAPNVYIKVIRIGGVLTFYTSINGTTFTQIATYTIGTQDVYAGVYHNPNSITETNIKYRIKLGPGTIPSVPTPNFLDGFTVYSNQQTILADRAAVFGQGIGSNGYVEVGADGEIRGNLIAGGNVLLRERAKVYGNLESRGTLTRQNSTVVQGSIVQGPAVETITLLIKAVIPVGTQNISVNPGQTLTLNPGNYGAVQVFSNATLTLNAGNYNLKTLVLEPDVKLILNTTGGSVNIAIKDNMAFGDRFMMSYQSSGLPNQVRIYSHQTSQLRLGTSSNFIGRLTAPRADIIVNSRGTTQGRATVNGVIYGNSVRFEPDVIIDGYGAFP